MNVLNQFKYFHEVVVPAAIKMATTPGTRLYKVYHELSKDVNWQNVFDDNNSDRPETKTTREG